MICPSLFMCLSVCKSQRHNQIVRATPVSHVTRSLVYYLQLLTISWLLWLITVSMSKEANEIVNNNLACPVLKDFPTASATKPKALLSEQYPIPMGGSHQKQHG